MRRALITLPWSRSLGWKWMLLLQVERHHHWLLWSVLWWSIWQGYIGRYETSSCNRVPADAWKRNDGPNKHDLRVGFNLLYRYDILVNSFWYLNNSIGCSWHSPQLGCIMRFCGKGIALDILWCYTCVVSMERELMECISTFGWLHGWMMALVDRLSRFCQNAIIMHKRGPAVVHHHTITGLLSGVGCIRVCCEPIWRPRNLME